ncbi:MAG: hypothetical protein V5A68_05450 [Candidatus Thermoplasmatota archaeon]
MQVQTKINIEKDDEIINHLLFHKSLIDEERDMEDINQYVELLKKTNKGEHISMENPFDRSIALTFELVLQNHMDPWNIDLVNFSSMYLNRAKKEKINLIAAGRIIYLAWKILKMQSDNLVLDIESEERDDETPPLAWSDIPNTEMYMTKDDEYSYTKLIMDNSEPPINEPVRRESKRKVTLVELLDALKEARKEAEEYLLIEKQRKKESERLSEKARERMNGTAHEDPIEKDVDLVWEKIKNFPKKTLCLEEICKNEKREETIKTILSILFLANDKKIDVYQKKFPFGKIYIKKK